MNLHVFILDLFDFSLDLFKESLVLGSELGCFGLNILDLVSQLESLLSLPPSNLLMFLETSNRCLSESNCLGQRLNFIFIAIHALAVVIAVQLHL